MTDIDWSRLPPLSTLRAFEATARLEGYSAAARSLNVTPAAIAQQVRKLEAEMGTTLVRRDGRGLALTEAGQRLAAPLRDAFALMVNGIEDVRRQEANRGVRVSTTHFFGDAVILPNLGDFWARHPGVKVSFSPDGNTAPIDLDQCDIAIRGDHTGKTWPGHEVRHLLDSPVTICAAPGLIADANGDLSSLPWLFDRSMGTETIHGFMHQAGFDPDRTRFVDAGNAKYEIEAAEMGYGLSISTELVIRRQLDNGSLVRVATPLDVTASYFAILRKGPLPDPVQRFLDWLSALCAHDEFSGKNR